MVVRIKGFLKNQYRCGWGLYRKEINSWIITSLGLLLLIVYDITSFHIFCLVIGYLVYYLEEGCWYAYFPRDV